jgi:hypothetical protein
MEVLDDVAGECGRFRVASSCGAGALARELCAARWLAGHPQISCPI